MLVHYEKSRANMEYRYNDPLLNTGDRTISEMGRFARMYVHSDPTSCIVKQGMIIEYIVTSLLREIGYHSNSGWDIGIYDKLRILHDEGYWNMDLFRIANTIRKHRNKAVHQFMCNEPICRKTMKPLEEICLWYGKYHTNSRLYVRECEASKKKQLKEFLYNLNLSDEAKSILDTLIIWSD